YLGGHGERGGQGMTGAAERPALGLVSSSTSETRACSPSVNAALAARLGAKAAHVVDRQTSRLRRMKHGVITAARLHSEGAKRNGFRYRPVMVTLTYNPGETWRARHITLFLDAARKWH